MKRSSRSVISAAVLCILSGAVVFASPGQTDRSQPISAQPATPCASGPLGPIHPESEWQPQIRVHPGDPDRLAVSWTQGFHSRILVAVSEDAGQSWSQHEVPISICGGGTSTFAGDAWMTWASDGTLHLAALTTGGGNLTFTPGAPTKLVATRSNDGGKTWTAPVTIEDDGRFNDRPALAVDPSDPQRLSAIWTKTLASGGFAVSFARSTDGGRAWGESVEVFLSETGTWPSGFDLRILPDGTILSAFEYLDTTSPDSSALEMALRSTDGGTTWSVSPIAQTRGAWPGDPEWNLSAGGQPQMRFELVANAAPSLAVAADGAVVAAWQDSTSAAGAIKVARSTDGGVTWSAPVEVRPAALGQAWGPTVAIDADGVIAVSWYDARVEQQGDLQWTAEIWAAHSHDDGQTWTEQKLGGPFDIHTAVMLPPTFFLGNYFGLAAMSDGFGAAFTMAATQASEPSSDIFFVRLDPGD